MSRVLKKKIPYLIRYIKKIQDKSLPLYWLLLYLVQKSLMFNFIFENILGPSLHFQSPWASSILILICHLNTYTHWYLAADYKSPVLQHQTEYNMLLLWTNYIGGAFFPLSFLLFEHYMGNIGLLILLSTRGFHWSCCWYPAVCTYFLVYVVVLFSNWNPCRLYNKVILLEDIWTTWNFSVLAVLWNTSIIWPFLLSNYLKHG